MRTVLPAAVLLASLLLVSTGCSQDTPTPKPGASPGRTAASPASSGRSGPRSSPGKITRTAPPEVGNPAEYEHLRAIIETERGYITLRFYPNEAPLTVANFITLAREGFYDDLFFHRKEPGFVIQGGDPLGTGEGGPGYTIPAEFNSHKHVPGAVAMARTQDPNSAGSQFYICLGTAPHLDNQYTVFAYVEKGMDNVMKLEKGDMMLRVRVEEIVDAPSGTPSAAPPAAK